MADGPLSDADIIALSIAEPKAFGDIYSRHFKSVYGYLGRHVGIDTALDLTAEVFVRAFATRSRFRREFPSARPWLMGIAANLLAGHFRGLAREKRAFARAVAHLEDVTVSLEDEALSRVHAEACRAVLVGAMSVLRPEERTVVGLFAVAGLSYAEIAHALSIPEGTVRSRLSRSRRKLGELLEDAQLAGLGRDDA